LIAATEGAAAAADYLGEATINFVEAGSLKSAFQVARQGMGHTGERRDLTWLRLASCDVMRREQEDAEYPGIPLDSSERREMIALVRSLSPDDLSGILFVIPLASRHELLRLRPHVRFNMWTGDFRGSPATLEEWATRCEREGRFNSAAIYRAGLARCRLALGEIAAADEAYAHAVAFRDRLPVKSGTTLAFGAYRFERCTVVNEGWAQFISTANARQAHADLLYSLAAIQAVRAVSLARLGQAEAALQILATIPPALERAPAWAPSYTAVSCNAAATLWCTERLDHAKCVGRNLLDKVIAPDFRTPMQDGRLALAWLRALQRRYDEAIEWFAKARTVLDEQGARPLRAIVDYDESLMYVRRGAAGDSKRAAPLLEAALAQFRDIGMPGWIRYAEHLLREGKEWRPQAAGEEQPPSFDAAQDRPGPLLGKEGEGQETRDLEPKTHREPETRDQANVFHREGEYWTVTYRGKTARLRDTKGLAYIARLLAQPGHDTHVRDLVALDVHSNTPDAPMTVEGDLGTILDARATAQYKERLADARQELEEATAAGDLGHAERLQHESRASPNSSPPLTASAVVRARRAILPNACAKRLPIKFAAPWIGSAPRIRNSGAILPTRSAPALCVLTVPNSLWRGASDRLNPPPV
jgi:tetratricopeptide (TPR) repeat protein